MHYVSRNLDIMPELLDPGMGAGRLHRVVVRLRDRSYRPMGGSVGEEAAMGIGFGPKRWSLLILSGVLVVVGLTGGPALLGWLVLFRSEEPQVAPAPIPAPSSGVRGQVADSAEAVDQVFRPEPRPSPVEIRARAWPRPAWTPPNSSTRLSSSSPTPRPNTPSRQPS